MSQRKDKKSNRYVPSPESVRRQLEKGHAREALKEAKLCFRAEASATNRALLEEAFLVRIQQLHRVQQPADAKVVLADLMAFGPTSPNVLEGLARLRVLLGETGSNTQAALDGNPSLLIEIADNAVLHRNAVVPNYADLPQHVDAVRAAFAAVETGDENRAIELLALISRGSPLADWRLFVRGLSAFYARDDKRAEANWSRLDGSRPAARIAKVLSLAANIPGSSTEPPDMQTVAAARRLAINSQADPVLPLLKELSAEWKQQNWKQFFRTYRQLRQKFAGSHEKLIRQVVDVVWKWAVRNADARVLKDLAAIGPAPELDPCWNRSRALQAEHPNDPSDVDDIESLWVAYVEDLRQLEFLSEEDRKITAGLVYQHLADVFRLQAEMPDRDGFEFDDDDGELVGKAIEYYTKSRGACPQLEASYLSLVKLYEQAEQMERAAGVMKELIRHHPDSFEAACWMASYLLSKDEPGQAAVYVNTAQRLRPRDPRIAALIWDQKLTMARGLVLNCQFEAARQEINDAMGLKPVDNDPCVLDLFRAGIELKAGNPDSASQHINAALAKVEEPAFVWIQMSSFAAVFRLARGVRKQFDDRLSEEIAKTPTSDTAGRIARFLVRMKTNQTAYVGRAGHERLFIKYLTRAGKISWQPGDLKSACEFLSFFPKQKRFRCELVDRGAETFSTVPHFAFWAGMEELNRHRTEQGERRIVEMLSSAISSHKAGSAKLTEKELETAMATLSTVKDLIEQRQHVDRFFALDKVESEDDTDEDDEDDEDDDGEPGFQMPLGMLELMGMNSNDDSSAEFEFDQEMLDSMERTMPPEIRRGIGQIAKNMGLSVEETMRRMILGMARRMQDAGPETSRQPRNSSSQSSKPGRK